jgi:hypothetical protein
MYVPNNDETDEDQNQNPAQQSFSDRLRGGLVSTLSGAMGQPQQPDPVHRTGTVPAGLNGDDDNEDWNWVSNDVAGIGKAAKGI